MPQRTYPWTNSKAPQAASRHARPLKPVMVFCFVVAVLLSAVLWLVPALPHYGYGAMGSQSDVALTFLSAAGAMIVLATVRMIRVWRSVADRRIARIVCGILGFVIVLLLAFMMLLVQLLSEQLLFTLTPQSPASSAYLFMGAVALSLVLLLKIVLKLDQLKKVPNA